MNYELLSEKILNGLVEITKPFMDFQKKTGKSCPESCGKCCFNKDVACHPFELLPLAFKLIQENRAEDILNLAQNNVGKNCILLTVINEEKGNGYCSEYQYRPSLCRAFGVAGRLNKNKELDFSICKILKEIYPDKIKFDDEIPMINLLKGMIDQIDPELLGSTYPINEALAIVLEKILLWKQYQN